jgi:hypothetical protein
MAPSLTRGMLCKLLLLLDLASAVPLGVESRGTHVHILFLQFFRIPQPGGPGPRIYTLQEQGYQVIFPGTGFPFRHLLRKCDLFRLLYILYATSAFASSVSISRDWAIGWTTERSGFDF